MAYNTYQNANRNFGRSLAFSEFLNRVTPAEKAKIVAAEQHYLRVAADPARLRMAAASEYIDSFKGPTPQALDPSLAM